MKMMGWAIAALMFVSLQGAGIGNAGEHGVHQQGPLVSSSKNLTPFQTCVDKLFVIDDSHPSFSHYGYGHAALHKCGIVQQIIDATKTNCCSGNDPWNGECRITKLLDAATGTVMLDGRRCKLEKAVKKASVSGLNPDFIVVCASGPVKNEKGEHLCPVRTYCTGEMPTY